MPSSPAACSSTAFASSAATASLSIESLSSFATVSEDDGQELARIHKYLACSNKKFF
jgi:hypothetical protein